jgi:hypothetical protein
MRGEQMLKKKLKLGFAPTRRLTFSKEEAFRFRGLILDKIKAFDIEVIDIDWLNDEGLLFEMEQVSDVVDRFQRESVDAVFVPHCNFGTEEAVGRLARKEACACATRSAAFLRPAKCFAGQTRPLHTSSTRGWTIPFLKTDFALSLRLHRRLERSRICASARLGPDLGLSGR